MEESQKTKRRGGRRPMEDRSRIVKGQHIYLQVRQFDKLDELAALQGIDRSQLIIKTFNLA